MKTFVTISGGILLALSCAATSDARLHANREGQTQSEPSNYNPEYQDSQTSTWNLDNSCLHCGATTGLAQTLPSYESNGFPITPLQAQAVSPKGMQERLSGPAFAGGDIQLRRIKRQCLAAPSKWPKSLCPPMSQRGSRLRRSKLCYSG